MDIVGTLTEGSQHIALIQLYPAGVVVKDFVPHRRRASDTFTIYKDQEIASCYHLILLVPLDFHIPQERLQHQKMT